MKQLFFLGLFLAGSLFSNAQACLPDSTVKDSAAGVYPKPLSAANPKGGITKIACIDRPYEFVFTIVIPDTVTIPGFGLINLNFASIATMGAIKNLPKGISYACNPPDCHYPKKTYGCIVLQGTPDNSNTPGDFKPIITLTLGTAFGNFNVDYPGALFPGEYILTLQDAKCISTTVTIDDKNGYWWPNPSNGELNTSTDGMISDVKLYNILGQLKYSEKEISSHQIKLRNELKNGMYLLVWTKGTKTFKQKVWIERE